MLLSFLKFAILATLGEVIGLRIRTGAFYRPGFGILPRALVWGFLGMTIHMAFVIFSAGVPVFLENTGLNHAVAVMATNDVSMLKVLVAFSISVAMNVIYAPVMMTLHKITDTHIENTGGTLRGLFSRMDIGAILAGVNWQVHWHFVLKKTIPFFWIPAHTITFLLPDAWRVLFAAVLGVILGVLLAVASNMQKKQV